MPQMVIDERIHETANITGTGEYTLAGAATGKQPLSVIGANNYAPLFVTDDINWELGLYTYVSGPGRAQRTHVVASSNGGAAVNWNNANVKIKCGWPAWLTTHGQVSKSVAGSSNVTLTALEQRCKQLILTGALTGNINVIVDETKWGWTILNNTTGAFTVTVKTASGTGVMVKQGKRATVECDGTNVVPLSNQALIRGAVLTRSSNTILGLENHEDTLIATATFTQTLTAAATLGDGWAIDVIVDSGATLTIDPNGSETIDGATTKVIIGPSSGRLVCNGTLFRTVGFSSAVDASESAKGIIEIATEAEIRTGSSNVLAMTPGRARSAFGFSAFYESAEQNYTVGGALTLAHSLGRKPVLVQMWIICKTAEGGYSVNDELLYDPEDGDGSGGFSMPSIVPNSTNLVVRYGAGASIRLPRKDTGATFAMTGANWRAIFRAWA